MNMRGRLHLPRFDRAMWRRAGFELVIVFVGVLVALLVNGWNTRRMERGSERQYLARLIHDVAADTVALKDLLQTLDAKTAALVWLQQQAPDRLSSSVTQLSRQLVAAQSAGFGVLKGNFTTFEDLRSTGNLSLLQSSELRGRIVAYYQEWNFNMERVEARRTLFPALVYAVLPPAAYDSNVDFDAPSKAGSEALDITLVNREILGTQGQGYLRGELNYTRFLRGVVEKLLGDAERLLVDLRAASPR